MNELRMTSYAASEILGGAPHLVDPKSDVGAWFVSPPGVVTQLGKKHVLDPTVVRFLTETLHPEICKINGRFSGFHILHDWSNMTGYDPDSRVELTEWCLRNYQVFTMAALVRPPVRPLLDLAITMAATALRNAGMSIRLFDTLEEGLREMKLEVLPPEHRDRARHPER